MSKRLKRRIQEVCGLDTLSKEDRVKRARDILSDTDEKQAVCHQIVGASFKDIEKALKDLINEKKPSRNEDKTEAYEDEEYVDEFFSQEAQSRSSSPMRMVPILNQEEVNILLQESSSSKADEPLQPRSEHNSPTWSPAEAAALIAGTYNPAKFRKKK